MTSLPPDMAVMTGIEATGKTLKELPAQIIRSDLLAWSNPSLRALEGRLSPKLMMLFLRQPAHFGLSQILPVLWPLPVAFGFLTSYSLKYSFSHFSQISTHMLP